MNFPPLEKETTSQSLRRQAVFARTLNQEQVDCVAYALGGLTGGNHPESWTSERLASWYEGRADELE